MLDKQVASGQYSGSMSRLKPALMRTTAVVLLFLAGSVALHVFRHRDFWGWPDALIIVAAIVMTMEIGAILDLRARKPRRQRRPGHERRAAARL